MQITDRVALITGGASGLGKATAQTVLDAGGRVALVDLNADLANQVAKELGDRAIAFAADVRDEAAVQAAVDGTVEAFGGVHININCAGLGAATRTVGRDGPMPLNTFEFVVGINLIGTFNSLRLCAAAMAKNEPIGKDQERGVIVNTASAAAFDGQIGQAAYSASKGGVVGMTLPIACDLGRIGVRICTIAPGIFETPLMLSAPDRVKQPLIDAVQFPHRLGEPPEFGLMCKQIIENPYLNGETIRLDGAIRMAPK
ncbi:MAG: SDR family NAD(P)-dependent oxidoreductase [Gammaproteobacteria bacterium]|nr:SDR family NAD(P)-dependent oxidoreductase [Gammaproteobacteria bacterium]